MTEFLSHVPLWVALLFVFLLSRGLRALQTRDLTPLALLALPAAFLVWGLIGVVEDPGRHAFAAVGVSAGILIGLPLGHGIASAGQPSRLAAAGRLRVAGSPVPMIILLASFATKFALASYGAAHPHSGAEVWYDLAASGLSGVSCGLFAGRLVTQVVQALRGDGHPATARAVAHFILFGQVATPIAMVR